MAAAGRPPAAETLAHLAHELGSEQFLADRLQAERQRRGWSQERLAREMEQAGFYLPQSAISKIENPATGGRRSISVQEAIGLAKVFAVDLAELLLPPDAIEEQQVMGLLIHGPQELAAVHSAQAMYDNTVSRVADFVHDRPEWRERLTAEMEAAQQKVTHAVPLFDKAHAKATFLNDVLDRAVIPSARRRGRAKAKELGWDKPAAASDVEAVPRRRTRVDKGAAQ